MIQAYIMSKIQAAYIICLKGQISFIPIFLKIAPFTWTNSHSVTIRSLSEENFDVKKKLDPGLVISVILSLGITLTSVPTWQVVILH